MELFPRRSGASAKHRLRVRRIKALADDGVSFAHGSEEELARFLDFYNIEWHYEPTCFPLEWDGTGRVTESVTPDFYLPQFDLYVEITTMKQSLVTRKNRKLRRLRELYPEINVKIFYGKDYKRLAFKFGVFA